MITKTVMDAVNELNAEWVYKDSISAYFRPAIPCDSGYWYYGESKPFNDEHVCTLEEFSECVSECSFNFGKCSHAEFNAWLEATKQHYSEAEKPIYTQAMFDNGELPSVGMLFLDNEISPDDPRTCEAIIGDKAIYCFNDDYAYFGVTADNCGPIDTRTDTKKFADDIATFNKKELAWTHTSLSSAIKAGKIHAVKWVGE